MSFLFKTPKAPDPYQTAAAQQNANVGSATASAVINNANENNPYGSVNYQQTGTQQVPDATGKMMNVPQFTRNVTLSPAQQNLLNLDTQTQTNLGNLGVQQSGRLQGLLGTNLDTAGLQDWSKPNAPTAYTPDMFAAQRDKTSQALLDRYHAQADPQRASAEATLAARGMAPGSQQWGDVQGTENRADVDAANQAFLAGGQEQSRMYGLQQASDQAQQDYSAFLNNLRGGQLQERQTIRNAPINEISALLSGSQVTVPQFQQFSRQGVDAAPVGQYINQNYQNQVAQSSAKTAGLFGLAGNILAAPMTGGTSLAGTLASGLGSML
jgi:hypothetical protein